MKRRSMWATITRPAVVGIAASTALAFGTAPPGAAAKAADASCAQEVEELAKNVRQHEAWPRIQKRFSELTQDAKLAAEKGEDGNCYALLASARQYAHQEGAEIEGLTDRQALDEAASLTAEAEAQRRTQVRVDAEPARVGVQPRAAEVSVEREGTQVDVSQQPTEVEVQQPQAQVRVQQSDTRVKVKQPRPDVDVHAAAPKVQVEQPPPRVEVQQSRPEIEVERSKPKVTIQQGQPKVTIKQHQPEVAITQPQPRIEVTQRKPVVDVRQPKPEVEVHAAKPIVRVGQAEPQVEVVQAKPEVTVTQRKPEVEVRQAEAQVTVEETRPQVTVQQGQPEVQVAQAKPQVSVEQGEPQVDVRQGRAQVSVSQARPDVEIDTAEGVSVDSQRMETSQQVRVQRPGEPQIQIRADEPQAGERQQAGRPQAGERQQAGRPQAGERQQAGRPLDAVLLREIEFGFDKAKVDAQDREILRAVQQAVERIDEPVVLLTGYASPIGPAAYNEKLSKERVSAVAKELEALGLSEEIIATRHLGERNPEVRGGENERSAENRRVEIRVLEKDSVSEELLARLQR